MGLGETTVRRHENREGRDAVNSDGANIGSALIDGWNPIIRNAIGHATYSLDANRDSHF
jgi:hypothetical protein